MKSIDRNTAINHINTSKEDVNNTNNLSSKDKKILIDALDKLSKSPTKIRRLSKNNISPNRNCDGFWGDVNGDGSLNVADIVEMVNIILNDGGDPSPQNAYCADMDGSGTINVSDIVAIVSCIMDEENCPLGTTEPGELPSDSSCITLPIQSCTDGCYLEYGGYCLSEIEHPEPIDSIHLNQPQCFNNVAFETQRIILQPQTFNHISFRVIPFSYEEDGVPKVAQIDDVFQFLLNDNVVVNDSYNQWIPAAGIDEFQNTFNFNSGYSVYYGSTNHTSSEVILTVTGCPIDVSTQSYILQGGVSTLIPYTGNIEIPSEIYFQSLNNLDNFIVNDGSNYYQPQFNVNTIELMKPGKSYSVYFDSDTDVSFTPPIESMDSSLFGSPTDDFEDIQLPGLCDCLGQSVYDDILGSWENTCVNTSNRCTEGFTPQCIMEIEDPFNDTYNCFCECVDELDCDCDNFNCQRECESSFHPLPTSMRTDENPDVDYCGEYFGFGIGGKMCLDFWDYPDNLQQPIRNASNAGIGSGLSWLETNLNTQTQCVISLENNEQLAGINLESVLGLSTDILRQGVYNPNWTESSIGLCHPTSARPHYCLGTLPPNNELGIEGSCEEATENELIPRPQEPGDCEQYRYCTDGINAGQQCQPNYNELMGTNETMWREKSFDCECEPGTSGCYQPGDGVCTELDGSDYFPTTRCNVDNDPCPNGLICEETYNYESSQRWMDCRGCQSIFMTYETGEEVEEEHPAWNPSERTLFYTQNQPVGSSCSEELTINIQGQVYPVNATCRPIKDHDGGCRALFAWLEMMFQNVGFDGFCDPTPGNFEDAGVGALQLLGWEVGELCPDYCSRYSNVDVCSITNLPQTDVNQNTPLLDQPCDCNLNYLDECGVCGGFSFTWNDSMGMYEESGVCNQDCTPENIQYYDTCGVCGGGATQNTDCGFYSEEVNITACFNQNACNKIECPSGANSCTNDDNLCIFPTEYCSCDGPNLQFNTNACDCRGQILGNYCDCNGTLPTIYCYDNDGDGYGGCNNLLDGYEGDCPALLCPNDVPNDWVTNCNDDCDHVDGFDCLGECGGSAVFDECGVCNGNGIPTDNCSCFGEVLDSCGECGGPGPLYQCWDGSGPFCSLDECPVQTLGCTNSQACNYDESANSDDGSCEYPTECYDCDNQCICDVDDDGICDDGDTCIGYYDSCGVCNGNGPQIQCWNGQFKCSQNECPDQPEEENDTNQTEYINPMGTHGSNSYYIGKMGNDNYDTLAIETFCTQNFHSHVNWDMIQYVDPFTDDEIIVSPGDNYLTSLGLGWWPYNEFSNEQIAGCQCCGGDCVYVAKSITCCDGECDDSESSPTIYGCTDSEACNYDESANSDDGSCTYPTECYDCDNQCICDIDTDGVCDDVDSCVGYYDSCGVCNGNGPQIQCWNGQFKCLESECPEQPEEEEDVVIQACTQELACNYTEYTEDIISNDALCVFPPLYYHCPNGNIVCIDDSDQDGICDPLDSCVGEGLELNECLPNYPGVYVCGDVEQCPQVSEPPMIPEIGYWDIYKDVMPLPPKPVLDCCDECGCVGGCTDERACNYEMRVDYDNGSCVYPELCPDGINEACPGDCPMDMGGYCTCESECSSEYGSGDTSGDGVANVQDVVQMVGYIAGDTDFTPCQIQAADLNGDGMVNVLDIVQLVNIILNNRSSNGEDTKDYNLHPNSDEERIALTSVLQILNLRHISGEKLIPRTKRNLNKLHRVLNILRPFAKNPTLNVFVGTNTRTTCDVDINSCDEGYIPTCSENQPCTCECIFGGDIVYGCTDEDACNYNESANQDDGSCDYGVTCWDNSTACNINDCPEQPTIPGCTDPSSCNFCPPFSQNCENYYGETYDGDCPCVHDDSLCVYPDGVCDCLGIIPGLLCDCSGTEPQIYCYDADGDQLGGCSNLPDGYEGECPLLSCGSDLPNNNWIPNCEDDCDHPNGFDCNFVCGGSSTVDECGVCGGNGIPDGFCDCLGNTNDECGVCNGPGPLVQCYDGSFVCGTLTPITEECPTPYFGCMDDGNQVSSNYPPGCTPGVDCLGACNYDSSANIEPAGVCYYTHNNAGIYNCQPNGDGTSDSTSCINDIDGDLICDEEDSCIGSLDCCGVCNGLTEFVLDEFGEQTDDCVPETGQADVCGVCFGPGATIQCQDGNFQCSHDLCGDQYETDSYNAGFGAAETAILSTSLDSPNTIIAEENAYVWNTNPYVSFAWLDGYGYYNYTDVYNAGVEGANYTNLSDAELFAFLAYFTIGENLGGISLTNPAFAQLQDYLIYFIEDNNWSVSESFLGNLFLLLTTPNDVDNPTNLDIISEFLTTYVGTNCPDGQACCTNCCDTSGYTCTLDANVCDDSSNHCCPDTDCECVGSGMCVQTTQNYCESFGYYANCDDSSCMTTSSCDGWCISGSCSGDANGCPDAGDYYTDFLAQCVNNTSDIWMVEANCGTGTYGQWCLGGLCYDCPNDNETAEGNFITQCASLTDIDGDGVPDSYWMRREDCTESYLCGSGFSCCSDTECNNYTENCLGNCYCVDTGDDDLDGDGDNISCYDNLTDACTTWTDYNGYYTQQECGSFCDPSADDFNFLGTFLSGTDYVDGNECTWDSLDDWFMDSHNSQQGACNGDVIQNLINTDLTQTGTSVIQNTSLLERTAKQVVDVACQQSWCESTYELRPTFDLPTITVSGGYNATTNSLGGLNYIAFPTLPEFTYWINGNGTALCNLTTILTASYPNFSNSDKLISKVNGSNYGAANYNNGNWSGMTQWYNFPSGGGFEIRVANGGTIEWTLPNDCICSIDNSCS